MAGNKNDEGKLRMDLIPSEPIEALATILTHGAKKYDDNNWMKGLPFRRVYAAMLRHLLAYRQGEYQDQESGHPHLWHAFCNLAFLIYYNDDKHYNRYEEFNNFLPEWAQKNKILPSYVKMNQVFSDFEKQETIPKIEKRCETCFYNNADTHEHCVECTKGYSLWEPQGD